MKVCLKLSSLDWLDQCWANSWAMEIGSIVGRLLDGLVMQWICLTGLSPQKRRMLAQILSEGVLCCIVEVNSFAALILDSLSSLRKIALALL